jgi:hypothetical protein
MKEAKTVGGPVVSGAFDGGNPQDPSCIVADGEHEFTVTPQWEDLPDRMYGLRFAVTVDHPGPGAVPVTVHVDWGTSEHMEYKHVYYVNREGDDEWREVEATVDGPAATVRLRAKPGSTTLSLSPTYNYARYLAFVDALAQRAEADVKLAGRSRERREIHHVSVPPRRRRHTEPVFFSCRNNACESAGNFMIEGMVRFLLSGEPEAAELMRHFSYHFLPMTNPDGVANGLERDTAIEGGANLGRMKTAADPAHDTIRKTLEKVRPAVFVNLHNWMFPELDGLLCNDEVYARGLAELLPQAGRDVPRRFHREWYSDRVTEVTERGDVTLYPLSGIDELHQESGGTWKDFCREQFGARAMAVEFPWFGRTPEDMRALGTALLKAVSLIRLREEG